jgi:SAM-dependent methyltransferase
MFGDVLYRLRTRALVWLLRAMSRSGPRSAAGLWLDVAEGVHDPGLPFSSALDALRIRAIADVGPGARVLDVGTGSGVWAILAARTGARVTATERQDVPLAPVAAAAARAGVSLELRAGDGLAAVGEERFDRILCNPPFHDGEPRPGEQAWVGGRMVRSLLAALRGTLAPGGAARLLLPRWEQRRYASELAHWRVERLASRWLPLLGRIDLLELRDPRDLGEASDAAGALPGRRVPMSPPARAWRRLATFGDTRSCELVALEGRLDAVRLLAAVRLLPRLHPLLSARADGDRWLLDVAPPRLTITERPRVALRDDLLRDTWDAGDPEESRVELIRDPERDWLRMLVPHDRTDARSGAQVIADLADLYGALETAGDDLTHPDVSRRLRRTDAAPWDPDRLLPLAPRDLWRAALRAARDLAAPASWRHPLDAPRGPTRVHVHDCEPDALRLLKARARAEGTTVHALMVVAAARALGVTRVADLHTLRPFASDDVDARSDVLVVPWTQQLPPPSAADPTDGRAYAAVRSGVAEMQADGGRGARAELARLAAYDALAALLPLRLAARATFAALVGTDVVVTNPGPVHVSIERFGRVPVRDFLNFPQLVAPARIGLGFTTFRGRLRIFALWDAQAVPHGVEAAVTRMCARLGLAVGPVDTADAHAAK